MTDEGMVGEPMDMVEVLNAFRNMATGAWAMCESLKEEGFNDEQAMKLVAAWMHGNAGGKLA
jgi:hypothetical protein